MKINVIKGFKAIDIILFIAILGSSIIAAKISGISIGKLCLIPLILYLLRNGFGLRLYKGNLAIAFFYSIMSVSCAVALLRTGKLTSFNGYYSTLVNYIFQVVVFYFPLIWLLNVKKNRDLIARRFERILVAVVRLHCFWAIIQEIFYFCFNTSINDVVFTNLFGGLGLDVWTSYCLFGNRLVIRASGLNGDPAYLGILLLLGFIFDKSKLFKCIYLVIGILTMSRTTILMLAVAVFLYLLYDKKITIKRLSVLVVAFFALMLFLSFSSTISGFIGDFFSRFDFLHGDISTWSISSYTHIMYYPCSISVFLRSDILKQLFGIGPRMDGIAFTQFKDIETVLRLTGARLTSVWCAESDFVGTLLGGGILGFASYYYLLIYFGVRSRIYQYKIFSICLIVAGLMYNYNTLTIINLCFIYIQSMMKKDYLKLRREKIRNSTL